MAEIPVERKGGIPWWVWLLLALLLAGLLYLLLANNDDDDVVPVVDNTPVEQPVVDNAVVDTTAGPITSIATLMGAPLTTMVGREVMLTGVPVESLEGDQSFYIGDSPTNRALVVFNEQPSPNQAVEGNVDVNKGSMVTVRGTVRDSAATPPSGSTMPMPAGPYIEASSVDVVS